MGNIQIGGENFLSMKELVIKSKSSKGLDEFLRKSFSDSQGLKMPLPASELSTYDNYRGILELRKGDEVIYTGTGVSGHQLRRKVSHEAKDRFIEGKSYRLTSNPVLSLHTGLVIITVSEEGGVEGLSNSRYFIPSINRAA